jgi:hypothetical protein
MSHINWHIKYILRHEDVFIYINRTCPAIIGHVWVLIQICQFKEFPSESALSPVRVTTLF